MRRYNYLKWNAELECRERQCIKCGEWWPDDPEFYQRTAKGHSLPSCRACESDRRRAEYRVKTAGVPHKRNGRPPRNPQASSTQAARTGSSVYILDILIELLVS
jgi:NAD-dependent SIR2 family protein deacetylase